MNSRARKRTIYARSRLSGRFWLTAEDRAWLDEVPVGREFGSKDYERLEILDAFTQGRIDAQKAMKRLGIDQDALAAMVEHEGLPKQFVTDTLQSMREADAGMLEPYEYSNDDPCHDSLDVLSPAREFQKK